MCVASWFLSLVEDGLYKGCVKFVYKMCAFVDEIHVGCVRSGCLMSLSYCVFDLCNMRVSKLAALSFGEIPQMDGIIDKRWL